MRGDDGARRQENRPNKLSYTWARCSDIKKKGKRKNTEGGGGRKKKKEK